MLNFLKKKICLPPPTPSDILIDLFCVHLLQSDTKIGGYHKPSDNVRGSFRELYSEIVFINSVFEVKVSSPECLEILYLFKTYGTCRIDILSKQQEKKIITAMHSRFSYVRAVIEGQKKLEGELRALEDIEKILKINKRAPEPSKDVFIEELWMSNSELRERYCKAGPEDRLGCVGYGLLPNYLSKLNKYMRR